MTFIQKVMNSLYSESALARREKRLIDRLILDETALNETRKELSKVCDGKVIDVTQMKRLEKKITELVVKISSELKDLLEKESVELQHDVESPQESLASVIGIVEKYITYLTAEKTVSKQTELQLRKLLTQISQEFEMLEEHIEQIVSESALLFTSIFNQQKKAGFEQIDTNAFLASGDVFEQNKVKLSQTIKSLYKKLSELTKNLNKEIRRYHTVRKTEGVVAIRKLSARQRERLNHALEVLRRGGSSGVLNEYDQLLIRKEIQEVLVIEQEILRIMRESGIIPKLDAAIAQSVGQDKKKFQTLVNKLKYYKTNSGVYPFEFWLGEKRALGFLDANDAKNLKWLTELLSDGLLHPEYGMLSERSQGLDILVAEGFLNSAHEEFVHYLEGYQKSFLELTASITQRADISQKVFAVLGCVIAHTQKLLEQTKMSADGGLRRAEKIARGTDYGEANRQTMEATFARWDKEQAEENNAITQVQKKLRADAGEAMTVLSATRGMEQRNRQRGISFLRKAFASLALASQLLASSTSPAVLSSVSSKATVALAHEAQVGLKADKGRTDTLPENIKIPKDLVEKIGAFFSAKKNAMLMITERSAYSTPEEHTAVMAKEHKTIDPFLELVEKEGIRIEYYPGDQLMLVYTTSGKLITNYRVRGGPAKGYVDPKYKDHYYGSTPAGSFEISKRHIKPYIKRSSSWYKARIKWGALVREAKEGDIEVSENGGKKWFYATGPKAKVKNFDREDFVLPDGSMMKQWFENPFGHLTIELLNQRGNILAEKIHPNADLEKGKQMDETKISHGCMHINPLDIDELARLSLLSPGKVWVKIYPYSAKRDAGIKYVTSNLKSTPRS
jgi:hypothetical protein